MQMLVHIELFCVIQVLKLFILTVLELKRAAEHVPIEIKNFFGDKNIKQTYLE